VVGEQEGLGQADGRRGAGQGGRRGVLRERGNPGQLRGIGGAAACHVGLVRVHARQKGHRAGQAGGDVAGVGAQADGADAGGKRVLPRHVQQVGEPEQGRVVGVEGEQAGGDVTHQGHVAGAQGTVGELHQHGDGLGRGTGLRQQGGEREPGRDVVGMLRDGLAQARQGVVAPASPLQRDRQVVRGAAFRGQAVRGVQQRQRRRGIVAGQVQQAQAVQRLDRVGRQQGAIATFGGVEVVR
jgi:hypothetical protein